MTKPHAHGSTREEAEAEEEKEEEEFFYESQDRILSSSNSSTSASEDEGAVFTSPSRYQSSRPAPKFPIRVRNYDAWISDAAFSSASLQQRRDRLLNALGLSSDPTLSRRRSSVSDNGLDFARSVLLCADSRGSRIHPDSGIIPSECEGCSCNKCEPSHRWASVDHQYCSQCDTTSSSAIHSICSFSGNNVNSNISINKNNYNSVHVDARDVVADNLPREGSACLNRPSFRRGSCRADVIQSDIARPDLGDLSRDHRHNCGVNADGDGARDGSSEMCTIKNLDTGKEFVVNEVRDDGTWKKLKEVGTGRQLTMEEFQMCVGHSPIVQELMRRQNLEEQDKETSDVNTHGNGGSGGRSRKRLGWLKSIKSVASSVTGLKERRSSDERDTSSEKGAQRSSSATDDSQDISFHGPERIRSRQYGKSAKELTALYKSQEIKAHNGSIWCIKFSLDGRYLATAGEDCVIHVWQVIEPERTGELLRGRRDDSSLSPSRLSGGFPDLNSLSPNLDDPLERKRRGRTSIGRKSMSLDRIVVPETVFGLSEKPICSFHGHHDDVLDLSWSKSQLLLSSSMDKTVRLWSLSSRTCLKIFSHSDYVTCIQFNPVDDRYFISGSLDSKVRIWSIPDRQVVDWNDLHEMVTAACYTPDGQGALVGSYKGNCRLYNTSENKLLPKSQINLQNKKKKAHLKKITGFQFAPGSSSEVLITSADSRVRVVDGIDLVHKFKGFRNSNSQISASITRDGKYVVSASEDSHVYIWKHGGGSGPGKSKGISVTRSYEHFHCEDVSAAIPWPGFSDSCELSGPRRHLLDDSWTSSRPPPTTPAEEFTPAATTGCSSNTPFCSSVTSATNSYFFDRFSATWPEEKLLVVKGQSGRPSLDMPPKGKRSAWGLVVVTAGLRGEIRTFQNFGLPARV